MRKELKGMAWLWSKGNQPSKSAFWQFMTTLPTTAFLWIVAYRVGRLPDELFVNVLVGAGAFFAVVEGITLYWYHTRRVSNPPVYPPVELGQGQDEPQDAA